MSDQRAIVRVGVQAIVRHGDDALFVLRSAESPFEPNTWGLPGGYLEPGDTIAGCAIRELQEEAGLQGAAPRIVVLTDPSPAANYHMQIGVEMGHWSGSPRATDPVEIADVAFFPLSQLPGQLFTPSRVILLKYLAGRLY